MSTGENCRYTNRQRIPQLQDRSLKLIEDRIEDLIYNNYDGTVIDGDLDVPIIARLNNFLQHAFSQLKYYAKDSAFVCETRPCNNLNERIGDKINTLLQLFIIEIIRRFPENYSAFSYIDSFTESLQDKFEAFQPEINDKLVIVGFYSSS